MDSTRTSKAPPSTKYLLTTPEQCCLPRTQLFSQRDPAPTHRQSVSFENMPEEIGRDHPLELDDTVFDGYDIRLLHVP